MDVSLNFGAELDDEELPLGVAAVETPPTPEPPEAETELLNLETEMDQLVSLESRLNDLLYLTDDIRRAHGMNQSFAMEAERLIPGFGGVPLGFYSKDTSATRYKVAMEELTRGMWGLIAAAAAAIIAAIWKLYSWLAGGDKEVKDINAKADDVAKSTQVVMDQHKEQLKSWGKAMNEQAEAIKNSDISKAVKEIAPTMKEEEKKPVHANSLNGVVEAVFKDTPKYKEVMAFLATENPIYHDIAVHGPYSQAIEKAMESFTHVRLSLEDAVKLVEKIAAADKGNSDLAVDVLNEASIKPLLDAPKIQYQGQQKTVGEIAEHLRETRANLEGGSGQQIELEKLLDRLSKALDNPRIIRTFDLIGDNAEVIAQLQKRLEAIEKQAGDMNRDGHPDQQSETMGPKLRMALKVISDTMIGYAQYSGEITAYAKHLKSMAEKTQQISLKTVHEVIAICKRNKTEIPEEFRTIARVIEEGKKQATKDRGGRGLLGRFAS